ncbi:unnamed protein product [Moneuplotes crassus]|uniref:Uncharacterized protein n=1 Tax=Euplotes crassus TaxID=5936 RepID=A0AAD2CWF5_EUPCR|nr:unnamed protein product [Moneuplotes crassus]
MKSGIISYRDKEGNPLPFSDLKNRVLYIDEGHTVKEDTSTVVRNIFSIYREYLWDSYSINRFCSYPIYFAASEAIFYMPNFFKMKVIMDPSSFNHKLASAVTTNIDHYMGHSKLIQQKIPKFSYIYKGVLSTSIPYTFANWGSRLLIFTNLKRSYDSSLMQCLNYYLTAFVAGFVSSLVTTPLCKMYYSNHHLQSVGNINFTFRTIYDAIFIETRYSNPRKTFYQKLQIWYKHALVIALRGGFQSTILLGTFSFIGNRSTIQGTEKESETEVAEFITSDNPLLQKLKNLNTYASLLSDKADYYRATLKASLYVASFGAVSLSFFDLVFGILLKDSIIHKKNINLQALKQIKINNLVGKNLVILAIPNFMRYFALLWTCRLIEPDLFN